MKILLALSLVLLGLRANVRADIPEGGIWALYQSCDVSAGYFLNDGSGTPRKDCAYPLGNVVVFQKIAKRGYLLLPDYELGDTGTKGMFLLTTADYPEHTRFNGEIRVKWIGTADYPGADGYKKTVLTFEPAKAK